MEIILDTHTLYWFLIHNPKLSKKAKNLLETAATVEIPSIVLMELLYLLKKKGKPGEFLNLVEKVKFRNWIILPLDFPVISNSIGFSEELEMHDAIITATASIRDAFLISKDREIKQLYPKVIW